MTGRRETLLALADALDVQSRTIRALAAAPEQQGPDLIDVKQAHADYSVGRDALLAAESKGELKLQRASRGKILVSRAEIERWLRTRQWVPRKPRAAATDLDAWEQQSSANLAGLASR